MARTILATFDSVFSASNAARDLRENGLAQDQVDLFSGGSPAEWEAREKEGVPAQPEIRISESQAGISIGLGIGLAVGITAGLLALIGEIALPGPLNPGPLANLAVALSTAIASMLTGGVAGGALGDLLKLGIPEEELRQYARNVRNDRVVLAVLADWDTVDPVIDLLNRHSPLAIEEKPYSRLKSAWTKKDGKSRGVQAPRREGEDRR